jgi:hypothetical protein
MGSDGIETNRLESNWLDLNRLGSTRIGLNERNRDCGAIDEVMKIEANCFIIVSISFKNHDSSCLKIESSLTS